MLPIERAEIIYPDGSRYKIPEQGTWAEAPSFGLQMVVYYHVPDSSGLQRITIDGGENDGNIYRWQGEGHLADVKMGMWMDSEGYYRIHDLVLREVRP